jgi:hypothetical protein
VTTTITDWTTHARRLADELKQAGKLTDPRWREAICAVARHELVPTYYRQDTDGAWQEIISSTAEGLAACSRLNSWTGVVVVSVMYRSSRTSYIVDVALPEGAYWHCPQLWSER